MARKNVTDKVARVLKLLIGLRNQRIAKAMAAYGFTQDDLGMGWRLLYTATAAKTDSAARSDTTSALAELDAWENRWFKIASVTLERRYPDIHAEVFDNLSQTSGPEVAVNVQTLIDRIEELGSAKSSFGANGKKARALLEERGVTKAVLHEGKNLLETIGTIDTESGVSVDEEEAAALAKAESELWSWYLEWSQIARIAITQKALLRQLGFGSPRRVASSADPIPTPMPTPPVVTPPPMPTPPVVTPPPAATTTPAVTMSVQH